MDDDQGEYDYDGKPFLKPVTEDPSPDDVTRKFSWLRFFLHLLFG